MKGVLRLQCTEFLNSLQRIIFGHFFSHVARKPPNGRAPFFFFPLPFFSFPQFGPPLASFGRWGGGGKHLFVRMSKSI